MFIVLSDVVHMSSCGLGVTLLLFSSRVRLAARLSASLPTLVSRVRVRDELATGWVRVEAWRVDGSRLGGIGVELRM